MLVSSPEECKETTASAAIIPSSYLFASVASDGQKHPADDFTAVKVSLTCPFSSLLMSAYVKMSVTVVVIYVLQKAMNISLCNQINIILQLQTLLRIQSILDLVFNFLSDSR